MLVAALAWMLPRMGVAQDAAMHAATASSLASIVFTAASSGGAHHLPRQRAVAHRLRVDGAGTAAGHVARQRSCYRTGRRRAALVRGRLLLPGRRAVLAFGRDRIRPGRRAGPARSARRRRKYRGVVSAVVGIGGGSLTVPLLTWRGVAPVRAVGTSSACGVFIGIGAALAGALQAPCGRPGAARRGGVRLPARGGAAVASVLAAPFGTRLAHRLSGPALKRVFAIFLLAVGCSLPPVNAYTPFRPTPLPQWC